ncbi:MAG: HEPN domain-containing protein [Gammaproteobacteria bacterium]|nr:HEPN domain-containing protein [Gammaproteobacteria bacterium]
MNTNAIENLQVLLAKALKNLRIEYAQSQQLTIHSYRTLLQKCRSVYVSDERHLARSIRPEITEPKIKQEILEAISRELSDFIRDGYILSASIVSIGGSRTGGSPVENLLRNLLIRAVLDGPEGAAQAFDKCSTASSCTFQQYFLLTGVTVPEKTEIFEGIDLIPLPMSVKHLPPYLPTIFPDPDPSPRVRIDDLLGKTLVRVNFEVSPIFHRPAETYTLDSGPDQHFTIMLRGAEIPNPNLDTICQALSVAGRRSVKSVMTWRSLSDYEMFDLSWGAGIGGSSFTAIQSDDFSDEPVRLNLAQLDKIKTIYRGLTDLPTETWEKLRIPIDRWAKSMAEDEPIDQIIDLGIALEALYVPVGRSEVRYRLSLHAAWHLGNDKNHRHELYKEFQQFYDARSDAVHTGKLRGKRSKASFDVEKFTSRAQDLCWQGIDKVIDAGDIPDWQDLIMGEERYQPT